MGKSISLFWVVQHLYHVEELRDLYGAVRVKLSLGQDGLVFYLVVEVIIFEM